ncbi:BTB POZ and TAZ domain-containing 1-like [Olea europaea subsp. europaea]|uniref:BTB POZ and TAZ domain-containing 1-like n=1 Tax=Olea europaea subsp. europaea TaxID=158383 RepID=A0A8S0R6Y5_OLEEU|nr:BTB POZ and TAZ domain-containing 1-like [Olea europaea subsp. europaea]
MVQLQNQFLENSPVARNGPMVAEELPEPDVQIITSGGRSIPAHSRILASASPVMERLIARPQKRWSSDRKIPILGVPYDAVTLFVQFLYSSKNLINYSCVYCDRADECRVPMCRQFKLKVQQERKRDSTKWRLLVRKVIFAKAVSSLSLVERKREEEPRLTMNYSRMGGFEL